MNDTATDIASKTLSDPIFPLVLKYAPGICAIGLFCFGVIAALKSVHALADRRWFKAILPILPALIGALVAVLVPYFLPDMDIAARCVLGATAGLNSGGIYSFVKRMLQIFSGRLQAQASGQLAAAAVKDQDIEGVVVPKDPSKES